MRRAILATAILAAVVSGCGGGSETTTGQAERAVGPVSDVVAAKADAICHAMIEDSRRMGAKFGETTPETDPLTFTTQELVKPAVNVLDGSARRLRELEPEADNATFAAYVEFFDPILAIARERVASGLAGDDTRAHALELQLVELSELQRPLARSAGLNTCDVDFFEAFTTGIGLR